MHLSRCSIGVGISSLSMVLGRYDSSLESRARAQKESGIHFCNAKTCKAPTITREVHLIDMRAEFVHQGSFSKTLLDAVEKRSEQKNKVSYS